jgi:hypothetical protein
MRYQLAPVEVDIAEGGSQDLQRTGQPVATFGFADEHEARIARALMLRAIAKAVLQPYTSCAANNQFLG